MQLKVSRFIKQLIAKITPRGCYSEYGLIVRDINKYTHNNVGRSLINVGLMREDH